MTEVPCNTVSPKAASALVQDEQRQLQGAGERMLLYDQRQGRDGLVPYSPEVLHSPVHNGCKCLDAQGLKEFRHHVMKVRGYRVCAWGDGWAGLLLGEIFHRLEVRDEG